MEIAHDFPDRALVVLLLFDYKFSHFDRQAISLEFIRHVEEKLRFKIILKSFSNGKVCPYCYGLSFILENEFLIENRYEMPYLNTK